MTASRDITIWCDAEDCSEWTSFGAGYNTVARTRLTAKSNGWAFRKGKDYCPRHSAPGTRIESDRSSGDEL